MRELLRLRCDGLWASVTLQGTELGEMAQLDYRMRPVVQHIVC
jgi:hypothetical protein